MWAERAPPLIGGEINATETYGNMRAGENNKNDAVPHHKLRLARAAIATSAFILLALAATPSRTQQTVSSPEANLQTIRKTLELPEEKIDLAGVKVSIDQMIDPSVDIGGILQQLDVMAADIKARFPTNASGRDKLELLRGYIYKTGSWNGNRPFQYDLADPYGNDIRNKLLSTYLATRKGNCISMPLLFIILGKKLGIDVSASTAPLHVFVKYRDDAGNSYNLETTSGAGFTRDVWIQKQLPMTAQALASGIYMQPLTKKETVVLMAGTLLELYSQQGQDESVVALAKVALQYYPKDVSAMLHASSAYYRLRQRHFVSKYARITDIPAEKLPYFEQLEQGMVFWRNRAEALGWREPDSASENAYQESIHRAESVNK
jgi:regulator of sirC expression with transglutaminase-like and TPR domain